MGTSRCVICHRKMIGGQKSLGKRCKMCPWIRRVQPPRNSGNRNYCEGSRARLPRDTISRSESISMYGSSSWKLITSASPLMPRNVHAEFVRDTCRGFPSGIVEGGLVWTVAVAADPSRRPSLSLASWISTCAGRGLFDAPAAACSSIFPVLQLFARQKVSFVSFASSVPYFLSSPSDYFKETHKFRFGVPARGIRRPPEAWISRLATSLRYRRSSGTGPRRFLNSHSPG